MKKGKNRMGSLQSFFESRTGQVVVVAIIVVFFLLALIPSKEQKKAHPRGADVKALTISALMVGAAIVLGQFKLFEMPQGGAVTPLSNLPIVLCAYYLGTRRGVTAGMCVGLLNLIFGPYVIHPLQMLLDYPLAFGALGLGGVMRNKKNGIVKGYILGLAGRYAVAVVSGIVFFGAYAPAGFNAFTWSVWYNFTYLAAEGVITVIIISIPTVKKTMEKLRFQIDPGFIPIHRG